MVEAETLLPPAMSARRWSWRSVASTMRAILPGGSLAPPGPDLLQVAAEQVSDEGERLARQRQRALIDKRGAFGGLGCCHKRLLAAGGVPAGSACNLAGQVRW